MSSASIRLLLDNFSLPQAVRYRHSTNLLFNLIILSAFFDVLSVGYFLGFVLFDLLIEASYNLTPCWKDYENETDWRSKTPQDDCGDLAVNPHGRKSICKVKPTELFQVSIVVILRHIMTCIKEFNKI